MLRRCSYLSVFACVSLMAHSTFPVVVITHAPVDYIEVQVTDHAEYLTDIAHQELVEFLRNSLKSYCVRQQYAQPVGPPGSSTSKLLFSSQLFRLPPSLRVTAAQLLPSKPDKPIAQLSGDLLHTTSALAQVLFQNRCATIFTPAAAAHQQGTR